MERGAAYIPLSQTGSGEEEMSGKEVMYKVPVKDGYKAGTQVSSKEVTAGRMEYFDAKQYGMVEEYQIGFIGHCVDISRTPGYLHLQATLSHPATSNEQQQPYSVPCKVVAAEFYTGQFAEKQEDEELGLREAPVVRSSVTQSWVVNEVGVKQSISGQQTDRYQGYLQDYLPVDTILQGEKKAIMALHGMHGDKLCDTMVSASCTDMDKSFRLEQIFNKKECLNNMEGEMFGYSEYAGGEQGVFIGATCNLGYSEAVQNAAEALFCVKDESNKHMRRQQGEEDIGVKLEFEQDKDNYGLYDNHQKELEPSASLVGNLPQLPSCFKSVEINPTDQEVKNMDNKISVDEEFINFEQPRTLAYDLASQECEVDFSKQGILFNSLGSEKHIEGNFRIWDMAKFLSQECPEIPAVRRIITSEVEVKDSSVLGAAQDPYAMAGVYEIPEVIGDGAKDTELYLGETKDVIDDNVETADNEYTKEAEPPDA